MGPLKVELVWGCVRWCRSRVMPWSITSESLWLYMLYPCVWPRASLTPFSVHFLILFFFFFTLYSSMFPLSAAIYPATTLTPIGQTLPQPPQVIQQQQQREGEGERTLLLLHFTRTLVLCNRHVKDVRARDQPRVHLIQGDTYMQTREKRCFCTHLLLCN